MRARPAAPRGDPSRTSNDERDRRRPAATRSARPTRTRRSCRRRSPPSTIRSRQPGGRELASGRRTRARRPPKRTSRIARRSFAHRHGSSNQARSQSAHEPGEPNRLLGRPAPGSRPRRARSRRRAACRACRKRAASSSGARPPTLNLQPREAHAAQGLDLLLDRDPRVVVAADRDHRQRLAGSRPRGATAAGRAPCRPRPRAPCRRRRRRRARGDGRAGCRTWPGGPAPSSARRRAHPRPEQRRDLLTDDAVDLEQRRVLVAGVGLADEPLLGVHAGDHGRAVRHLVPAAAVRRGASGTRIGTVSMRAIVRLDGGAEAASRSMLTREAEAGTARRGCRRDP